MTALPFSIDATHLFPGQPDAAARYADAAAQAARQLVSVIERGKKPFLRLPGETADLAEILAVAQDLRTRFAHVVVVGTGGSSLGARCLAALAPVQAQPQLHFLENVDPHSYQALREVAPLAQTAFLFISKSGGTLETLAQALLIVEALEAAGGKEAVARQCVAITQPGHSPLRTLAETYGMRLLTHDPELGGRFSVMGNVGLLPVACLGLDIAAIRRGAQAVISALIANPTLSHPAVQGAVYQQHFLQAGRNIHVLMPYADRLKLLGDWFRQLTAESLGKDGQGFTPLSALGAIDHHSMLQLFLDGPADKWFSFITVSDHGGSGTIPAALAKQVGMDMVAGQSLTAAIDAAARGTIDVIADRGLPVRTIRLARLDEEALGALLMLFMMETALTATLMGVDAYDQPAVEASKQRTKQYLMG
jgi:glucose-6-phosphate isomerase